MKQWIEIQHTQKRTGRIMVQVKSLSFKTKVMHFSEVIVNMNDLYSSMLIV